MMILVTLVAMAVSAATRQPSCQAEFIFPPEPYHNHSSTMVVTPQGDLLACWFHGYSLTRAWCRRAFS